MESSENFRIFLQFIHQKLEKLSAIKNHLNWKGTEAVEFFNDTDVCKRAKLMANFTF